MQQSSSFWTKVHFFHEGDDYFREIEKSIRDAKDEILIETYIFELDELTRNLLQLLAEFREKGGQVQLLVDGFGSYFHLESLQKICAEYKIDLKIYRPIPKTIRWIKHFRLGLFFRSFFILRRFNRRNHRKTVIIDRHSAYLGSYNWAKVHSKSWMGEKAWRDSGVLLQGPGVDYIRMAFQNTWVHSRRARLRHLTGRISPLAIHPKHLEFRRFPLRINTRLQEKLYLSRDLIKHFKKAEKRIWIASAYFLPKRSFLRALRKAAKRGVDVQIIWPGPTDVPAVKWAAQPILKSLIQAGAQIHEYLPRVLHAKYLVVDDWATIGSANFNHRSYFHDLEIEVEFDEPEYVAELMRQWKQDRSHCRTIRLQDLEKLPFWQKILSWLAYRLRYLL